MLNDIKSYCEYHHINNSIFMWVRNYLGKMIYFNEHQYSTNQEKYKALWKIKYNADFQLKKDHAVGDNLAFLKKMMNQSFN